MEASESSLAPEEMALFGLGRKHYLTACATCHGNDGSGLRRFAPPLRGSEWVTGDKELAAIMTYIRNEWGHSAGSVSPRTVGGIRHTSQGRIQPWNVADIKLHMERTAGD